MPRVPFSRSSPRSFSSRDQPPLNSLTLHPLLHAANQGPLLSASGTYLHQPAVPTPSFFTAGRSCLGLGLFQVCRTPTGAPRQARPCLGHPPPETASGSYPLLGFFGAELNENGTDELPPVRCLFQPAPTLQRIERPMPGRSSFATQRSGPAPCLRFRTICCQHSPPFAIQF